MGDTVCHPKARASFGTIGRGKIDPPADVERGPSSDNRCCRSHERRGARDDANRCSGDPGRSNQCLLRHRLYAGGISSGWNTSGSLSVCIDRTTFYIARWKKHEGAEDGTECDYIGVGALAGRASPPCGRTGSLPQEHARRLASHRNGFRGTWSGVIDSSEGERLSTSHDGRNLTKELKIGRTRSHDP